MANLSRHRVLIAGVLSPIAAMAILVCISYYAEHWVSRVPAIVSLFLPTIIVLTSLPFILTIVLANKVRRGGMLTLSGKIGVAVASLSLICPVWAGYGEFVVWRAGRNVALRNIPAPIFSALDLDGISQSLTDQKGKVVLVNVWATWCAACRAEMPELDRLYRKYKEKGVVVFGLSDEDPGTQKKSLEKIHVTYPLLTYQGEIPPLYRQVAAYPTTFLIDRQGRLQRGIEGERYFGEIEQATVSLLGSPH